MRVRGRSSIGIIMFTVLATATIIGASASAVYLFMQNRQLKQDLADYTELKEDYNDLKATSPRFAGGLNDTERLLKQVGMLVELPAEVPTLIPIDDREKVKTIEFFKNAQTGDVVLVYAQAKFAVLYRPTAYKVIMMGPQTFTLGTR